MKLESQVCSLELAKKLKELNVKQESLFYWHTNMIQKSDRSGSYGFKLNYVGTIAALKSFIGCFDIEVTEEYISAFTVSELGEMLPADLANGDYGLMIEKIDAPRGIIWGIRYGITMDGQDNLCQETAETEADARASMLVYLIENSLITL